MIYLATVRGWLKTPGLFEHYSIGRTDNTLENMLTVYDLDPIEDTTYHFGAKAYDVAGFTLLIRGTDDKDVTEKLTQSLFEYIRDYDFTAHPTLGTHTVYFAKLRGRPHNVTGSGDTFEYVIDFDLYYI